MATKDQRFELPDGSVYIVTGPAADSDGEWVEMEWHLPADCLPPPPHIHPSQVEEYEVLEGSLDTTALTAGLTHLSATPSARSGSLGVAGGGRGRQPCFRHHDVAEGLCETIGVVPSGERRRHGISLVLVSPLREVGKFQLGDTGLRPR